MKIFHCDHCGQLLFFENTQCVNCGHRLAYLPDLSLVGSLDASDDGWWRSPLPLAHNRTYRLCRNYADMQVCNWAIPGDDPHELCASCRLTRVIPDLSVPAHHTAWYKLEVAKRRLVFTLLELGLPVLNRDDDPAHGLAFEFRADSTEPGAPWVMTGHSDGIITINIAEADDVERERRRQLVREPFRTLLGHVRHESGHYYWDRLIKDSAAIEKYRAIFGDERLDYNEALRMHYDKGAPVDWQANYVSEYASAHSWEDWAETWAHYLHIVDTVETAAACGLSLKPRRRDEPSMDKLPTMTAAAHIGFEQLIESWFPLTYVLNNLNRGLGVVDAYPFVLSQLAIEKLQFVHDVIEAKI
jgi:hypothetical protein